MAVRTFHGLVRRMHSMLTVNWDRSVVAVILLRTLTLKEQVINLDKCSYNFWGCVVDLGYLGVRAMNCYATLMVMNQNLCVVDLHRCDVDLLQFVICA